MNGFARQTDTSWNRSAEALFGCLSPIRPPRRCIAFRHHNDVGIRDHGHFVAQLLAYTLPYRRFACALTDADARLGADVDR